MSKQTIDTKHILEKLLRLYDSKIKSELEDIYKGKELSVCDKAIFFLVTKSTKTTRAILRLINTGYIEDGFILLRSLLENLINACFILQNKQIYSQMFIDFSFYDWYRKTKEILETSKNSSLQKKAKAILQKADSKKYQEIKEFRDQIKGSDYTWSKRSLKEMAKDCRLKDPYYDKVYFILSQYAHPHFGVAKNYYSSSKKEVVFDDSPNLEGVDELLISTTEIYLRTIKLLTNYTGIKKFDRDSKDIESKFREKIARNK